MGIGKDKEGDKAHAFGTVISTVVGNKKVWTCLRSREWEGGFKLFTYVAFIEQSQTERVII